MQTQNSGPGPDNNEAGVLAGHHLRFHRPHVHLASVFGGDWFALKAEAFARFFGTPIFLVVQSVIVMFWIGLNVVGVTKFDVYPFILLTSTFAQDIRLGVKGSAMRERKEPFDSRVRSLRTFDS
jgi:Protein of unknown function (DUF1003)